jgi:hypothetical protein
MLGHTDRNGLAHMLTILLACPILTQWAETHIASWPEYLAKPYMQWLICVSSNAPVP